MPLTVCKKCDKIFSAGAKSCPYCGAVIARDTQVSFNAKDIRSAVIGLLLLGFLTLTLVISNSRKIDANVDAAPAQTCQTSACPGGTRAVTLPLQQEPYYTCKSGELSDYANHVLSVMRAQASFAGIPPKLSAQTGEPEVQGKERLFLDQYRAKAGVVSFYEALSKCYRGVGHLNVMVIFNPKEGDSIYVAEEENQDNKFWLPRTKLSSR